MSVDIPPIERLFSKGPHVGWSRLNRNLLPAPMFDLDGEEIAFGKALLHGARLPAMFLDTLLVGDLIPSTSWGSSLANLLTRSAWNALRLPVIQRNSGVCEFCGDYLGKSLEIHEVWSYSELALDSELTNKDTDDLFFGRQKLDGLVGVCRDCHACFHYGLALVRGTDARARERFSLINGWTYEQVDKYIEVVFERNEFLSRHNWLLDLSLVASQVDGLIIGSDWVRDEEARQVLFRDNDRGSSITVIANCKWKLAAEEKWSFLKY